MRRWIGQAAAGCVGAAVMAALLLLTGIVGRQADMTTINVQRINVREPDGTLRMVISNTAREPGIIVRGREQPHPNRRSAGLLFYNDEGTENGGLIFDGHRDKSGVTHSGGSLTFDRYEQDQAVQLTADEEGPARHAGLVVNDHPDAVMDFAAIDRARTLPPPQQAAAYRAAHLATTRRVYVGSNDDGSAELQLRDASGTSRLVLRVDPAGAATIAFLDAQGHILRTITPSS